MAFIREISPEDATPEVRALYDRDRETLGHVANYTKVFAHRPEVYTAWVRLIGAIRSGMDKRRYELITLAAASQLRSSYCMLAHGTVLLRSKLVTDDELEAIARDYRRSGLSPAEVAMMTFAEKVTLSAHAVTPRMSRPCGGTGSPTPRSSTSRSPPPRAASSARPSMRSAPCPTTRSGVSTTVCARS